jgi:hypothetical protein
MPHEQALARLDQLEGHHPVSLRCTLDRNRYEQFRTRVPTFPSVAANDANPIPPDAG